MFGFKMKKSINILKFTNNSSIVPVVLEITFTAFRKYFQFSFLHQLLNQRES